MKYKGNTICLGGKKIEFCENINQVIEVDRFVAVWLEYSHEHPTNNLMVYDRDGNKVWEIDEVLKPFVPQSVVAVEQVDDRHISATTYEASKLLIEVKSGRVVERKFTK